MIAALYSRLFTNNTKIGSRYFKRQLAFCLNKSPGVVERENEHAKDFPLLVFHPHETIRMRWDFIITIVMLYMLVNIPIQICFRLNLPLSHPWLRMDLFIDALFFVDIIFNFNTGYINQESQFVHCRVTIAKEYMKCWFWIDLITSIPFEYMVQYHEVSILAKILKAFRVIRLLKVLRVIEVMSRWEQSTPYSAATMRMTKFAVLIFLLAHILACLFIGLETVYREKDQSYANYYGYNELCWIVRFQDTWEKPLAVIYMRALYWAFTTLTTVGYGDITPLLPLELAFTIAVQLCGCSLFGFIIGNVSSIVSSRDATSMMLLEKMEAVRDYITFRKLPKIISDKILRHYNYAWRRSKVFQEEEILFELPQVLRTECCLFVHRKLIKNVPLLSALGDDVVPSLVTKLKPCLSAQGDIIVLESLYGNEMYFVSIGQLQVTVKSHLICTNKKGTQEELVVKIINDGDYFAEYAVMMDQVKHPATVISEAYCDMFVLTRADFLEFAQQFPEVVADIIRESKKRYIKLIEAVMKSRHHHSFMLNLNLDGSDLRFEQAAIQTHLSAATVNRSPQAINNIDKHTNRNPQPSEMDRTELARKLSFQIKAAPIVTFDLRLQYYRLQKIQKSKNCVTFPSHLEKQREETIMNSTNFCSARNGPSIQKECFPKPPNMQNESLSKVATPRLCASTPNPQIPVDGCSTNRLFGEVEVPNFSTWIMERLMAWKDRARLEVISRRLNIAEDQLHENSKQSGFHHSMLSTERDSSILKEVRQIKSELAELKALLCLDTQRQTENENEKPKSISIQEFLELKTMFATLENNQQIIAKSLGVNLNSVNRM